MTKVDVLSLSPDELSSFIVSLGEKRYRADQIYTFLMRGAGDFSEISNIPKSLIEKLKEHAFLPAVKQVDKRVSRDGTAKYLYELYDGEVIESVIMR